MSEIIQKRCGRNFKLYSIKSTLALCRDLLPGLKQNLEYELAVVVNNLMSFKEDNLKIGSRTKWKSRKEPFKQEKLGIKRQCSYTFS